MKNKFLTHQAGFSALLISILVLMIVFIISTSIIFLVRNEQKISSNILKSSQAYYTAEAGVEDALLRLVKKMNWSSPYPLNITGAVATIEISDIVGGSRTISSQGALEDRIRKVQIVYQITAAEISFYYGVQVGNLGLQMNGNAIVHGNIFSNGPITGDSNTKIYGDAVSAGPSGSISNMKIDSLEGGGSVWAKDLTDCLIDSDAHYTNISNCSVGGTHYTPEDPLATATMPITEDKINDWKDDTTVGGTILGYSLDGNNEDSLGPIKVDGDMSIDSNAILTVTGTIWVTGNLDLNSNVILQLDSSYGPFSGVIVVDGQISVDSNVTLCGSEGYKEDKECNLSIGSYLMLLSTNNSTNPGNPAIEVTSNTETAILYTSNGLIRLSSNAALREATGYGIYMDSNAEVTYETGLADVLFSSGPGGSWEVVSWQEVE